MKVVCILLTQNSNLSELAEAFLRFSPQIAIGEPNRLFIEIGKCRTLYSETSFLARAKVLLRRFKLDQARIAISSDIPSALALARYGTLSRENSSAFGLGNLPPNQESPNQDSIDHLPIDALEDFADPFGQDLDLVGRKLIAQMIESLRRLGIETLHQFKTIPPSLIPSRFGKLGLYCRQRIEDSSQLPWPFWSPPETFSEKMELLPSEICSEIEPLLFKSKEILDRLFSRLRGRVLRAEKIRFSIELEKYSTVQSSIRQWNFEFISPQGSTLGFLPILRERLNWNLSQNPIESFVTAIQCEVLSTAPGKNAQRNFFHQREDYEEAMGSLFGQLEEYLGAGHVFWARTTEERIAEKSWIRTKDPGGSPVDLKGKIPQRPTRVFKIPVPIRIIEDRILFKGKIFKTLRWSCVERISLDWLDDFPARNYYRVELEGYRVLWAFSDPSHHFFVHGYFE